MAIELEDRRAISSRKNDFEPNVFYRYESIASSACRIIGILGVMMSVTLSNIFFFDMYNCENHRLSSSNTIAIFLGYDWYYITNPGNVMGICEYWTIILIQLINLYNNGTLVVATFTKSRWCSINWMIFTTVLLVFKSVSMFTHLKNGDQTSSIYIFGSILYLITLMLCLIIILFAQLAWIKENDEDEASTVVNQSILMKKMETSVFDSPTAYEPNFNYCSF